MDMDDARLEYLTGSMSVEEAFERGVIDSHGLFDDGKRHGKTCRCCGITGLFWGVVNGKYRLFDAHGIHNCPVNPLRDERQEDPA